MSLTLVDWSQCPLIESDPEKHHGDWVFKGTRLPISATFRATASGASIADVIDWYGGITAEQIAGVFEFGADSLEAPDQSAPEDGPEIGSFQ